VTQSDTVPDDAAEREGWLSFLARRRALVWVATTLVAGISLGLAFPELRGGVGLIAGAGIGTAVGELLLAVEVAGESKPPVPIRRAAAGAVGALVLFSAVALVAYRWF
jgi:hypothetical protein